MHGNSPHCDLKHQAPPGGNSRQGGGRDVRGRVLGAGKADGVVGCNWCAAPAGVEWADRTLKQGMWAAKPVIGRSIGSLHGGPAPALR